MKARIKTSYQATEGNLENQTFEVYETAGRRVTVMLNGRQIDFGQSEVELITE